MAVQREAEFHFTLTLGASFRIHANALVLEGCKPKSAGEIIAVARAAHEPSDTVDQVQDAYDYGMPNGKLPTNSSRLREINADQDG